MLSLLSYHTSVHFMNLLKCLLMTSFNTQKACSFSNAFLPFYNFCKKPRGMSRIRLPKSFPINMWENLSWVTVTINPWQINILEWYITPSFLNVNLFFFSVFNFVSITAYHFRPIDNYLCKFPIIFLSQNSHSMGEIYKRVKYIFATFYKIIIQIKIYRVSF